MRVAKEDVKVQMEIPGAVIRWVMRASAVGPRALQLRVVERQYRP